MTQQHPLATPFSTRQVYFKPGSPSFSSEATVEPSVSIFLSPIINSPSCYTDPGILFSERVTQRLLLIKPSHQRQKLKSLNSNYKPQIAELAKRGLRRDARPL